MRSYPTRASYSGQVDEFRNAMKNELKTRPCLKPVFEIISNTDAKFVNLHCKMKRAKSAPKAKSAPMSLGPIWPMLDRFGQTLTKTALDGTHWAPVNSELAKQNSILALPLNLALPGAKQEMPIWPQQWPIWSNINKSHTKRSSHV